MPTVRNYGGQQIQPKAAPTVLRSGYGAPPQLATPLVTQPKTEGAYSQFGTALAGLGQQAFAQEVAKQDQVRLNRASNDLATVTLASLYDPQNGALVQTGEASFGAQDRFIKTYDDAAGKIRQGLKRDRLRIQFDQMAQGRRNQALERITEHVATQTLAVDKVESGKAINNEIEFARLASTNPAQVSVHLDNARKLIAEYDSRRGAGPLQIQADIDSTISTAHGKIISDFLAKGQDPQARAWYSAAQREMSADDRLAIEKDLHTGTVRGESQREADRIVRAYTPDSTFTGLLDEAGKITDPDIRAATEDRIKGWWIAKKQDESFAEKKRDEQIKATLDQANLNVLNAIDRTGVGINIHKLVDSVAPGLWNASTAQKRDEWEKYAKRLETKGAARTTDESVWYGLLRDAAKDPEAFAKRDLYKDISKLSDSDFQEVAKWQKDILAGKGKEAEQALRRFRSTDQIITGTFAEFNIPKPKEGTPEFQAAARLHRVIAEKEADYARTHNNQTPDDETVRKWVDDQFMNVPAFKGGSWLSLFPGGAPFTDTKIQKRAMDITTADIPENVRNEIAGRLRAVNIPVTDDNIIEVYLDAAQKIREQKAR